MAFGADLRENNVLRGHGGKGTTSNDYFEPNPFQPLGKLLGGTRRIEPVEVGAAALAVNSAIPKQEVNDGEKPGATATPAFFMPRLCATR